MVHPVLPSSSTSPIEVVRVALILSWNLLFRIVLPLLVAVAVWVLLLEISKQAAAAVPSTSQSWIVLLSLPLVVPLPKKITPLVGNPWVTALVAPLIMVL